METYNVVIADDSHTSRSVLHELVSTIPDFTVIGEAEDGEDLVRQIMDKKPQLVLTDIDMPKLSGITAYKRCLHFHPNLKVIFISGFENYAVEAFGISAVDYIVKPVQMLRLRQALDRAKLALQSIGQRPPRNNRLIIKTEGSVRFIPLKDILFIEKIGRHAVIHTTMEVLDVQSPLHLLLSQLNDSFVLAHRSFIINLQQISSIVSSGDTYMAYFRDYAKPAYISKHKYNEVIKLAEGN